MAPSVAAAGESEGMRPWLALTLLVVCAAGLLASFFVAEKTALVNRVPFDNPPEVLVARAREIDARRASRPCSGPWRRKQIRPG